MTSTSSITEANSDPALSAPSTPSAPSAPAFLPDAHIRRLLRWELLLLLGTTFAASGLRSIWKLIQALTAPERLNERTVTLNAPVAEQPWLDALFQLTSTAVLLCWGGLGIYLLLRDGAWQRYVARFRRSDWLFGAGGATLVGLSGLALYALAVQMSWTQIVSPAGIGARPWALALLVLAAIANAVAEEVVVVAWLTTRLGQLGAPQWVQVVVASVLRGSYHLYQGPSAGVGNVAMGLLFTTFFVRTRRLWPLVIAHALIDTVAFVGAALLAPYLGGLIG